MTDQPMTEHQTDPATIAHHDDQHSTAENGAVAGVSETVLPPATAAEPRPAAQDDHPGPNGEPTSPVAPPEPDTAAGDTGTPEPVSESADTTTAPDASTETPDTDAGTPDTRAETTDTWVEAPMDLTAADEPAVEEPAVEAPAAPSAELPDTSTETPNTDAETPDTRVEAAMDLTAADEPAVDAPAVEAPTSPSAETTDTRAEATDTRADEPVDLTAAEPAGVLAAEPVAVVVVEAVAVVVPPPTVLAAVPVAAKAARPAPVAVPDHAPLVRSALADPGRWGRIDGERNVYVRTADGERLVGSWQAGEPAEGLSHFARRFDDLLTEVELIAARLASGHGDPKQSLATVRQLKESLAEAHVVGDVVGLDAKLDYLLARAEQAMGAAREAREAARGESTARKQTLVEEAERIAVEATQWKHAGDRLREILDEWKTIRGVDRKTDDALWKRFGKARDAFNRRRGSHFAEMDRQRGAAKTRKEEIVAEAEELSLSGEWGATAGRYKQLMVDWKAAGRAPKDADDVLWQRFRAAQDAFFARRSAAFTERDSELTDNARRKEELLAEAERVDPATDLEGARGHLQRLQERWDAIGHVPRERMRELEGRLRAVEERVRGAVDAQWRRSDPETEARVAQFRERVEQFEAQAAKARAAGDERRAKRADEQAAQWREWLAAAERAVADR